MYVTRKRFQSRPICDETVLVRPLSGCPLWCACSAVCLEALTAAATQRCACSVLPRVQRAIRTDPAVVQFCCLRRVRRVTHSRYTTQLAARPHTTLRLAAAPPPPRHAHCSNARRFVPPTSSSRLASAPGTAGRRCIRRGRARSSSTAGVDLATCACLVVTCESDRTDHDADIYYHTVCVCVCAVWTVLSRSVSQL